MKIDWNIAPDATHYDKRKGAIPAFMRKAADGPGWEFRQTNGGWMHYAELTDEQVAKLKVRPAPWTGEGLPPVGTVCEIRAHKLNDWSPATIKFASRNVIVWDWEAEPALNGLCTAYAHAVEIRPIRTPEQISAEEREAWAKDLFERLYPEQAWRNCVAAVRVRYLAEYDRQVKP